MIIKEKSAYTALVQTILAMTFLLCISIFMGWAKPAQMFLKSLLWQSVAVELQQLELTDTQPSGISVRYDYSFADQQYTSQQLRASDANWIEGERALLLYGQLRNQQNSGSVIGWVDPYQPQSAILDRNPLNLYSQNTLLTALVFIFTPLLFIWWPVLVYRLKKIALAGGRNESC